MVFCPLVLLAEQTDFGASQEAAPWLKLPVSARTAGMGGAFGAMGEDITSLRVNPAGLVQMDTPQLLLTHNAWFQGVAVEHISVGAPLDPSSGIGLSFDYLDLGTVDAYTVSGNTPVPNGTFNSNGFNVGLGYGLALTRNFDAGVVIKYFQQSIANSSVGGVGGDIGVMVHGFIPRLSLGLAVENIGSDLQATNLPTDVRVALALKTDPFQIHAFNLALDADKALDQAQAAAVGAGLEYWFDQTLALRVGDQVSDDKLGTVFNGLTFGAGVNIGPFQLDYAFMGNGYLGNSNLFSLLVRLDKEAPPQLPVQEVKIVDHINKNIQFSYDSAYLKSEFNEELARLGDILLNRPQDHVVLTGYASREGTAEHNQELSEWRANEVRDRLHSRGVPAEQIISVGRGETSPVLAGETEKLLSPNRRVEIRIIQPRPGKE